MYAWPNQRLRQSHESHLFLNAEVLLLVPFFSFSVLAICCGVWTSRQRRDDGIGVSGVDEWIAVTLSFLRSPLGEVFIDAAGAGSPLARRSHDRQIVELRRRFCAPPLFPFLFLYPFLFNRLIVKIFERPDIVRADQVRSDSF